MTENSRGTRRWAVIGAAIVATAIAIFAVLSLSSGSGGSALAEAGERVEGQSMRLHMELSMPVPEENNARVDFEGEVLSVADGSMATMTGDFKFDDITVPTDMRMIRDDLWANYKTFREFMPPGKPWVHLVDSETPSETLTPSEYAQFLAEADDVDVVDENAEVDGKPTTHYRGLVDVEDMAEEIGGETESRYEDMFGARNVMVPIEAWIGRDGLPARIKLDCGSGDSRVTVTADILEYGVPVEVKPPPAERTIEEAEFDRLTETGSAS
jgi:hypothetical protein